MSKKIECRLPDQFYLDLKTRCQEEGITVTDAVISNVSIWLYPVMTEEKECHDKPETPKKEPIPIPPAKEIVPVALPGGIVSEPEPIRRPVYTCTFFNPQPKAIKPDKPSKFIQPATRPQTIIKDAKDAARAVKALKQSDTSIISQ